MTLPVAENKAPDPVYVGFFVAVGVILQAKYGADTVRELRGLRIIVTHARFTTFCTAKPAYHWIYGLAWHECSAC